MWLFSQTSANRLIEERKRAAKCDYTVHYSGQVFGRFPSLWALGADRRGAKA